MSKRFGPFRHRCGRGSPQPRRETQDGNSVTIWINGCWCPISHQVVGHLCLIEPPQALHFIHWLSPFLTDSLYLSPVPAMAPPKLDLLRVIAALASMLYVSSFAIEMFFTSEPSPPLPSPSAPAVPVLVEHNATPTGRAPLSHEIPLEPYSTARWDLHSHSSRRALDVSYFRTDGLNGALNMTAARQLVKDMFFHSWINYLNHGYPHDELKPLSCTGHRVHGDIFITLIDSADTLAVLGEWNEFARAIKLIEEIPDFHIDTNVSVFETNIRILGGLISTHVIAERFLKPDQYDGGLLNLAVDLGDRLMKAFTPSTGIPYGTVNLAYGVPPNETPVVCTACATSLSLEFGYLSQLTGDPKYYEATKRAAARVWKNRSSMDLMGSHIDSINEHWTSTESGIAGQIDSAYEYFLKTYLVFHDPFWYQLFIDSYTAVEKHAVRDGWHILTNMHYGGVWTATFSNLQAFWSGLQVLAGELAKATGMMERMSHLVHKTAFLPELWYIDSWTIPHNREWYQRPEMIESMVAVYQATKDPGMLEAGFEMARRIYDHTWTPCGYAAVRNVETLELMDRQESFFLSETLKYLYLLFDPANEFNKPEWVFTTEAHPLPVLPNMRSMTSRAPIVNPPVPGDDASAKHKWESREGRRTWKDEQCDVMEWRMTRDKYKFAPPDGRGSRWFKDWGWFEKKVV
ncbi:glycoside hydrolase [Catenaria anguillulae PL171]|uniref:alpha-1,2-Mannosidase n=1 Tax=Catenaria anguillulae PL171 TaxID=765915 RepID=A0A1Y2I3N0_9FUNG|nr:glycoside hydrolase [Catenaria anguillulae PL171]